MKNRILAGVAGVVLIFGVFWFFWTRYGNSSVSFVSSGTVQNPTGNGNGNIYTPSPTPNVASTTRSS